MPMKRLLAAFCLLSIPLLFCWVAPANSAPPPGKGKQIKTAPLAQTGQTIPYASGDDGDLRAGIPSPDPRFIDHADGTATDRLTGLMWRTTSSQEWSWWLDALNECNSYSGGGFDDWRLPNFRELLSLIDVSQRDPMLPVGHPFTYIAIADVHGGWYWSSTTYPYNLGAYVVALDRGDIRVNWPKTGAGYVLCARGGA